MNRQLEIDSKRLEILAKEAYDVLADRISYFNCEDSLIALKRFIKSMRSQRGAIFSFRGQTMGYHVFPFFIDLIVKYSTSLNSNRKFDDDTIAWLIDKHVNFPEMMQLKTGELNINKYVPEWLIRNGFEQLGFQEMTRTLIPRTLFLYLDIPKSAPTRHFKFIEAIEKVVNRQFKVSLEEVLLCTFTLGAIANSSDRFKGELTTDIEWMKPFLESDTLRIVRNHLTLSREKYQKKAKSEFSGNYTYIRTEPLLILRYPIIQYGEYYICPDYQLLLSRVTKLLHSWVYEYFVENGIEKEYPALFGEIFKEYIGILLKCCYGNENVHDIDELTVLSGKKADWVVISDDKAAIVECKFLRYPIELKETGNLDILESFIEKRISPAFEQLTHTESQWPLIITEIPNAKNVKLIHKIILIEDHFELGNRIIEFIPENEVISSLVKSGTQLMSVLELETIVTSNYANKFDPVINDKTHSSNRLFSYNRYIQTLSNFAHDENNILDQKFNNFFRRDNKNN